MTRKRLVGLLMGSTFFATVLMPAIAFAQEHGAEEVVVAEDWHVATSKAISAGFAMGLSALAAGYAQAKIGSAGAGTLAERPEAAMYVVILQALPEIIVLLGFVAAIILSGG